jgi:hypothetical protein
MSKDDIKRGDNEGFGKASGKHLTYSDSALANADRILKGGGGSLDQNITTVLVDAGIDRGMAKTHADGITECIDNITKQVQQKNIDAPTAYKKAIGVVKTFIDGTGLPADKLATVEKQVGVQCLTDIKRRAKGMIAPPSQPAPGAGHKFKT